MPASEVAMYAEQIEALIAEEKLRLFDVMRVVNAAKQSDVNKSVKQWQKQAGQDTGEHYKSTQLPPGFGAKKNG